MSDGPPLRRPAMLEAVDEPAFVLDRRRRLRFVNAAWVRLTGLDAARAVGLSCRRPRPASPADALEDIVAHVHTPPPEALRGDVARVRRLFHRRWADGPPAWWDVEFFPLRRSLSSPGVILVGRVVPVGTAEGPWPPLPERLVALGRKRAERYHPSLLESKSPEVRRLAERVRLLAPLPSGVLISGEAGTGRRTVARVLHALGPNRERAFVGIDGAALPAAALVDRLTAPGFLDRAGTLYVAEPGSLPRDVQAALCDLFPEEASACRLVVATSRGPEGMLDRLYWRASVCELAIPALRERIADLPALAGRLAPEGLRATPAALDMLAAYRWPGNLRELAEVLAEAADSARARNPAATAIDPADLPLRVRLAALPARVEEVRAVALDELLTRVERNLIEGMLAKVGGNRTLAAERLGVPRARLLRRIRELGLGEE